MDLVEALDAFNRKERYWVICNALGNRTLDKCFRKRLSEAIGLQPCIPEDAWWAIDYHFDWLAGALFAVKRGFDCETVMSNEGRIVRGSQEDIDLIVAFDDTLILVEAKGVTGWNNDQLRSKVGRLESLLRYQGDHGGYLPDVLHMVLMSPKPNPTLPTDASSKKRVWPERILDGDAIKWLELRPKRTEGHIVVRCRDEHGTPGAEGSHWKLSTWKVKTESSGE